VQNLAAFAENWFGQGSVVMATGAAITQARSIAASGPLTDQGTYIQLATPLTLQPAIGDIAYLFPGCDKTMAACANKFANLSRFGGFPFIPAPEMAV
jgi:uncharacterized phage protein (TIGR02218 family)